METSPETPVESSTLLVAFHHRAIASSILIGLAMMGLFGNGLVITSVIITKKLRTLTNILVINLAFADILIFKQEVTLSTRLSAQSMLQ